MTAASRIEITENYSDVMWRLNNLYWCVTEDGVKVPFRLNGAQQKLMDEMWFWNIVLKSRQHGFTTLISILALDSCLFNDDFSAGTCAHTREDVEKIFNKKVKFPYECLPEGLKTGRPADTDTAKKLVFNNNASIEVATSLRSGTYQFVHISEFGKICAKYPEKAREIVTGTFETVHPGSILFVESTAEGREGYFYRYVNEARKRQLSGQKPNKLQFKLHFFAWYEDPRNTLDVRMSHIRENEKYFSETEEALNVEFTEGQKAWYATKKETLEEDIKREHPSTIEEAFEAAVTGAYLSKQMAGLRKNNQITTVPHDPTLRVNTGWDFGLADRMCIWLHQLGGLQHRLIGYITGTDDDVLYYWRELQKLDYLWGFHFLPHDSEDRRIGTARHPDEKPLTLSQILYGAGMRNIKSVPRIGEKRVAIEESRLFLPMCWIDQEKCDHGINSLDNFKREWNESAGEWKDRPQHNWAIHGYDAFETLARGVRKFGVDQEAGTVVPDLGTSYPPLDREVGI